MNACVLRFGAFEIDVRSGELRKRGVRVALREQPFRVLVALLERPGEVVSRDDLCRRVWPDGTHVDFEHGLNAAVRRLRVALADDGAAPRFVETVPRRGYRFGGLVHPRLTDGSYGHLLPAADVTRARARLRLALLPFVSPHDDAQQELFSDGLTHEATAQLARRCPRHVGVIARTTVMLASRAGKTTGDIALALGADYLLEGSVRCAGNRVCIITQLIDARDETHLWAERYEREVGDSLDVQAEVAGRMAQGVADALAADDELNPVSNPAVSGRPSGPPGVCEPKSLQ
jgi:TolB-like protein/DNA-binding winged helix-turn-helix (wHTH) protein